MAIGFGSDAASASTSDSRRCAFRARFANCVAIGTATSLAVLPSGCLTKLAIDEWEDVKLESARLEVIDARPDSVRLRWKAKYRGAPARQGRLKLDPQLSDCADVRVTIRDLDELVRPFKGAQESDSDEAAWRNDPPGPCDVVILVTRVSEKVALQASNASHVLAEAKIKPPHDNAWLAVIPMAAVGDAAIVVSAIPLVYFWGLADDDEPTTWTWTP